MMNRLGITQAQAELTEITAQGAELGIRIAPLPLFHYVSVKCPLEAEELAKIDWLCFTSARGVVRFFHALKEQRHIVSPHTRFAVVGAKTAGALEAQGFTPDLMPQTPESVALFEELLERLKDNETTVYVGAETVRFDPAEMFAVAQLSYRRLVVYRAEPTAVSPDIALNFSAGDSILFTSPKAARRYNELFGAPQANILAIGGATAAAIEELGWEKPETLPEPDMQLALECCLRYQEKATG